jgi:hypothetical protein
MTTVQDIIELLQDDMVSHGFLVQCIAEGGDDRMIDVKERELIANLLSTGKVEIGHAKLAAPDYVEFVAWTGTVESRVERAINAVTSAVGPDREFAYWLCRKEGVDRFESNP